MKRSQSSIIMLMILMAIIMAVGGFLAVTYLFNRPDTPEGVAAQTVDGVEVMVRLDPAQTVELVGQVGAPITAVPTNAAPAANQPVAAAQTDPATAVPTPVPTLPIATLIPPTATPVPQPIILIDYVVQLNDSLYGISQRIDTSIALMAQYNLAADNLVPGTTIKLPVGNPLYCPGRRPYAVGEGDTAFSIGRRFNISADELQAINHLDASYTVRVAEILCVP